MTPSTASMLQQWTGSCAKLCSALAGTGHSTTAISTSSSGYPCAKEGGPCQSLTWTQYRIWPDSMWPVGVTASAARPARAPAAPGRLPERRYGVSSFFAINKIKMEKPGDCYGVLATLVHHPLHLA